MPGCTGYEPCGGKGCGESCSICDPTDADCVQPAVEMFCDDLGQCNMAFPLCGQAFCAGPEDCPEVDGCAQCPDGTLVCSTTECLEGRCETWWPGCEGYGPCVGKLCGESCAVCDPNDPDCMETDVLKYCDDFGQCSLNFPACGGSSCLEDVECPQIGAPCTSCPDGGQSCPVSQCLDGQCVVLWEGCPGYDPCAGLGCGDVCSPCDPSDPDCYDPTVMMYCNPIGVCQMSSPFCQLPD